MSARRVAVVLSALALAVTGIPVGVPALVGTSVPRAAAEDDPGTSVFLNEIHYANSGVDTGEFVEIAGPSGAELEGFQIVLYNGETGEPYDSQTLTGSIPLNGVAVVDYPVEGVQDGPDAVALVDGAVVSQFLSYGGEVTATDGPAAGLTSTALGLAESEETPPESSLQVTGVGDASGDFSWSGPTVNSRGAPNDGQTLTSGTAVDGTPLPTTVADVVEPGAIVDPTVPASDLALEQLIEGESLVDTYVGIPVTPQESANAAVFSGDAQLRVNSQKVGDSTTVTFQVPTAGQYRLWADQTRGANFGNSTLAIDGVVRGVPFLGGAGTGPLTVIRRVPYGVLDLAAGEHTLTLTTVGVGGRGGFFIGLDVLRLRLVPPEGRLTLTPWRGDSVRGVVPIYGTSTEPADKLTVRVDGEDVTDWDALGEPAMLVYEGQGIQAGPAGADFMDGISVRGKKTVLNYDVGNAAAEPQNYQFWTDAIDISGELLHPGENVITFFTGPDPGDVGGNKDDFNVKDVRLVLADGTVLRDPNPEPDPDPDSEISPTTILPINDNIPERRFRFTIPPVSSDSPGHTLARGYLWDTTKNTPDGAHTVTLRAEGPTGEQTINYRVFVDNHPPVINSLSPTEGSRVKGDFTVDATVVDDGDARPSVTATLDNSAVDLGQPLSSDDLAAGTHTLTVTATDTAGNTATKSTSFTSVPQTPGAPQLIAPEDGGQIAGTQAQLKVRASDPDGDALNMTFLKATPVLGPPLLAEGGVAPGDIPAPTAGGGTPLDPQAVAESDDVYADAPSTTDFPYQRYDVRVTRVRGAKEVELSWEGRVAPDREVVLSVWDMNALRWTEVASGRGTAGADTTIVGATRLGPTIDGDRVHVLVHGRDPFAEIPSTPSPGFRTPDPGDFSVAWMTDTQYLSQGAADGDADFAAAYQAINDWIVANAQERRIVYAAHTGDLINNWQAGNIAPATARREFAFASRMMKILEDAHMPYGVTPGNHDNKTGLSNVLYNEYFPPSRFDLAEDSAPTGGDGEGYYGGSWQPSDNQNHYDLIEVGDHKLIFLYLGFIVGADEIDWANQALAEYRDRKAVLLTHSYLLPSMTPDGRGGDLTRYDGAALFNDVVLRNENVFLTLSGHTHGVALNIKRDTGVNGRAVVEMLSNYQFYEDQEGERKTGHLRLLQFNSDGADITVDTYSPILNDFNANEFDTEPSREYTESADEFVVPADLATRTTGFRTDSIGLALRTDTVIGTASVASGGEASVTWSGLVAGARYGWYARATDPFGVSAESTVFSFTTGTTTSPSATSTVAKALP